MKKNSKYIVLTAAIALCAGSSLPFLAGSSTLNPERDSVKSEVPYCVTSPSVPDKITFAGQAIDLLRYDHRERMDRELMSFTYMHSSTMQMIKRANRYFPVIEPLLKANGIPDDFKYLMVIESNLNPIARSPAGAAGLWQFMPVTAREFGLEVNDNVDERYHIEKLPQPPAAISSRLMPNMATGWLYLPLTMPDKDVFPLNWTNNWRIMPWTSG